MLQNPHILLTFEEVHNPLRLPREAIFRLPPVRFFFLWFKQCHVYHPWLGMRFPYHLYIKMVTGDGPGDGFCQSNNLDLLKGYPKIKSIHYRFPKWRISHWENKKSPWQTQDNHVLCMLFSFLDLILDEFQASRSSITVLYDTGVGQSTTESVIWCSWYSTCFNKAIGFNHL